MLALPLRSLTRNKHIPYAEKKIPRNRANFGILCYTLYAKSGCVGGRSSFRFSVRSPCREEVNFASLIVGVFSAKILVALRLAGVVSGDT